METSSGIFSDEMASRTAANVVPSFSTSEKSRSTAGNREIG